MDLFANETPQSFLPSSGTPKAIDLFAGAGGFSTGAVAAGCEVVWAANHWKVALEWHEANHPKTAHYGQDLQQADFRKVPAHDILLASPACQGHSRARGTDKPHHDALRATAWAVVSCAEVHKEAVIVVENVAAFMKWVLFPAWCAAMNALGYSLAHMILDSADFGVPQNRQRLFVIATRSRSPISLSLPKMEHVGADTFINFEAGAWSKVEKPGRADRTLERVKAGRRIFGDRFLIAYYGNERGGRDIRRPIGTITTHDRYAVVDGDRMRMVMADEYRAAMGFPHGYLLPESHTDCVHLLGNAVCPPVPEAILSAIRVAA
jgi:DNA (cytosine-5)-methyltransferase 1